MSPAVALPHPAPRPERAGALRRALGILVFLGGLLLLGLAFGGRAEAAEPVPQPVRQQVSAAVAETGRAVEEAAGSVTAPVGTRPALQQAETYAGQVVNETVTATRSAAAPVEDALRETVHATLDRAAQAPVVRDVTEAVGDVRDPAPAQVPPGLPDLPAQPASPQPAPSAAAQAQPEAAVPGSVPAAAAVRHLLVVENGIGPHAAATAASAYEPTPAPTHDPAPGRPCGAVAAGQSGAPRGGDEYPATLPARTPCGGPVRGATLPATVAVLLDRADDVLEFPG
ncbi:hypothetical protein ABZO31_20285 [Streptomyces sp. HUAS MG47]|uniref:hypothetical protein n=1 Tax=Streptomyces solicamelliae TaxID=3231716 RepID=UPI003878399B